MEFKDLIKDEHQFVKFELSLNEGEYKKYLNRVSLELQRSQPAKGYRYGKLPLSMASSIYGNELFSRANDYSVNECLNQVCIEHDLAPVSPPNIAVIKAELSGFAAIISFYTYPNLSELDYKSLKPEKYEKKCSEKDIDDAINQYMLNHRIVHEVNREARIGDIVDVDFTGTCKGESFPFDHSKNSRYTLGTDQLFAGLDKILEGHFGNENFEVSLTMPADFHREEIAGLTLDLKVHLNGVWERTLLECTDEYVKENIDGCNTVADFRERMRSAIQNQYDGKSKRLYSSAISEALADSVTCYIPEPMIQVCIQRMIDALSASASVEGLTAERALQNIGKTVSQYKEECRPVAEKQVKLSVALDFISRSENIIVSEDEIDTVIRNSARANQISFNDALNNLGGRDGVREELLSKKALELVKSSVTPVIIEVEKFPNE